nr:hypothetical protein [Tanacetum cinerariifolium]
MIPDPNGAVNINGTMKQILEPLFKMTEGNKKQYIADVKVMNYLLQAIPNDIYNSFDACKNAKEMWEQIKSLMFGYDVTSHVRHSRLMDEFDKFATKEGESFESVYERLTTLVNIVDSNNVRPISVMARIQPADGNVETMPSYNAKAVVRHVYKVYDPFLKAALGYKNPKRLKKAIAAQQKMYDGEKLHSVNLKIDSPDSKETLKDAKEIRLKMRNKM